jgi:CubicO group peptidase (beta-lactamase class C family)
MVKIMDRHGIPGGSLAIAKDGKLVYAKGFGWANLSTGTPARLQRG